MKKSELHELIYRCLKDNHFAQYGDTWSQAKDIADKIEDCCLILPITEETEKYIEIAEYMFKWDD